jgi:predicted O-methyltransferase YrrM
MRTPVPGIKVDNCAPGNNMEYHLHHRGWRQFALLWPLPAALSKALAMTTFSTPAGYWFFAPPGHFYSPIPDEGEAAAQTNRALARQVGPPAGVAIPDDVLLETWQALYPVMASAPFEDEPGHDFRYGYSNGFFSYGDALVYYALIATRRPKRIVEIGSGHSSALALDARDHLGLSIDLTFIEPYPATLKSLLRPADYQTTRIIADKVQNVDMSVFQPLEPGDILFIDSSHVMKTGSDVCFEIFEILPALKPGVIVHFHDVFYHFEYPAPWVIDERRGWNELYALRAFLMYNSAFEIVFFNNYFMKRFPEKANDPATKFARNEGGGLWMRKR